ncbi:hypothetical protein NBRC10513v2_003568 [Rhodotorula toruloides]|uniref:Right handed beta helix domain-containing protein n=1 Tax=Rhodotorula toruloides TaxID=5286 RepID=A0A0K3C9E6_RHOTO|nr:hypothetical protein AAT19DRAFT_12110 [Rhodotorula toruloides]
MLVTAGRFAAIAALLLPLAATAPTPTTDATAPSKATPLHIRPTPRILPLSALNHIFDHDAPSNTSSTETLVARSVLHSETSLVERDLFGEQPEDEDTVLEKRRLQIRASCLDSTATDATISSLFYYGGQGTTVFLCPGAVISTTNAIFFTAPQQTLTTYGNPTGSTRATIRVTASNQSCAVYGAWSGANNVVLRNVQVDGNRPGLGLLEGGLALLEFGGNTVGQTITQIRAFEPRGWSCLHASEGDGNQCSSMIISNNAIGPSGHAPSSAQQFRKRDSTGSYGPYNWADGISIACKASSVTGNTIMDATDGAIVIFGALGSNIQGNTVISNDRQLMGGINLVDFNPYGGSFAGTVVQSNTVIANTNFIKVGIAVGGLVWGSDNRTASRTYGGTIKNNVFRSGWTGYFGYAIAASGHNSTTITGNSARQANFGGVESSACFTSLFPLPPRQAFVDNPWTTPGSTLQAGFYKNLAFGFAICLAPGRITARGSPY